MAILAKGLRAWGSACADCDRLKSTGRPQAAAAGRPPTAQALTSWSSACLLHDKEALQSDIPAPAPRGPRAKGRQVLLAPRRGLPGG